MINKGTQHKIWLPLLLGLLFLLIGGSHVQADTTPINNTGSGAAAFDNNGYKTSEDGATYATGTASGGTSLTSETGVGINVGVGNFRTFYTDNAGADSQGQYPLLDATNVNNLESGSGSGSKLDVDNNGMMTNGARAYTGGHIKVVGSLPLTATISSSLSKEQILAGNYGVMVRIQLPKDVDASKMSDAIEWDKAYFFMQLDNVSLVNGSPTFPMQFDHHVYLDPNDKSAFYLKTKGIPITLTATSSWGTGYASMHLARYSQDAIDYQNNITNKGHLKPAELGTSATGTDGSGATSAVGDAWGFTPLIFNGAVAKQGDVGWSFAVANYASQNSLFLPNGFSGTALINFYVNIAKYNGNIADSSPNKQLTAGKLPPSPRQDGLFNIGITAYNTNQLVDPFSATASNNKGTPGKTPMDYALVKSGSTGTAATVTSNITSWNAYVSPWDAKKTLNAAVSAWESVGGDKTRLTNVA
ncbi:hypothetical protein [Loigolactobacillus jiayinensis]|uniref:Uncharacterized protein n=1 Tax=Loigolactobacillus jiayinensis TaxID=2486016 RepID=A0ABW1RHQ8_9LACO|nr:hypothetical protein [Loigolactobacillus jiayinensis]